MKPAPHCYRDSRLPTDLRRLVSVAAPNLLGAAWNWRYELALVSGLSAGLAAAIISFGAVPTIVAATVVTLTALCWPMSRRFAVDRVLVHHHAAPRARRLRRRTHLLQQR